MMGEIKILEFLERMEDNKRKYYNLFLKHPKEDEYRNQYKYFLGLTQGLKIILK